jgi:hypothetical protein
VKLLAEVEIKRKLSTWDNLNIILATFLASTIACGYNNSAGGYEIEGR